MDAGAVSLSNTEYESVRDRINTSAVSSYIVGCTVNSVLNAQPPKVSTSVRRLSHQTQRVLLHIQLGYCSKLASYQERVGMAGSSACPDCLLIYSSVRHS